MKKAIASFVLIFFSLFHAYSQSGYSIYYHTEGNTEHMGFIERAERIVFNDSMCYGYSMRYEGYDPYQHDKKFGRYPSPHDRIHDLSLIRPMVYMQESEGIVLHDQAPVFQWTSQGEQKSILGYLCSKAIMIRPTGDTINVYYTSQLPGAFGPAHYYGLPGVILEATDQASKWHYVAERISHQDVEVVFPEKLLYRKPSPYYHH